MGLMDGFTSDGTVNMKHGEYYSLMREAAKAELIGNAAKADVPSWYICAMLTGKLEAPVFEAETVSEIEEAAGEWAAVTAAVESVLGGCGTEGQIKEMMRCINHLVAATGQGVIGKAMRDKAPDDLPWETPGRQSREAEGSQGEESEVKAMAMRKLKDNVMQEVQNELNRANERFPLFNGPHEGCAFIAEEAEETAEALEAARQSLAVLWDRARGKDVACYLREAISPASLADEFALVACEAIQAAAMCLKYGLSVNDAEPERTVE